VHTVPKPGSGHACLNELLRTVNQCKWPSNPGVKLHAIARDIRPVIRRILRGPQVGALYMRSEQVPDPDSRVALSEQCDCLGQPLARLDWRLSEMDKRTLRVSALVIGRELARAGFGTVRLPLWLVEEDGEWPHPVWAGSHHMGTTRMSSAERDGVVNTDCRLHQVHNLYVAGSSVFPTGGYANPTWTLVALAFRLADHVTGLLRRDGEGIRA
jgi:choline dehydrogenase-like flavoprotein